MQTRMMGWHDESQRLRPAGRVILQCRICHRIQLPGANIALDLFVPRVCVEFIKPRSKLPELFGGKLADVIFYLFYRLCHRALLHSFQYAWNKTKRYAM